MKHVWAHGPRSPVAQPSYNGGNWGNESNLVEADFALGINLTPGMKVRHFESHEMWSVSCHLVDGFHKLFVMNLTCVTWCNLVPSDFGYNHTSSNVLNYQGPNGVMVSMAPQLWHPCGPSEELWRFEAGAVQRDFLHGTEHISAEFRRSFGVWNLGTEVFGMATQKARKPKWNVYCLGCFLLTYRTSWILLIWYIYIYIIICTYIHHITTINSSDSYKPTSPTDSFFFAVRSYGQFQGRVRH